ncbi:heavy metal-associated isoprenylated plant protein 21-like [Phaseolus vulgaris]|uniref:heavy metal-associated isoprenylated plant protein 21-like n=1 Tax=Phaseolus vulgaris TaxID=3885 RepID=UPI0035CC6551
MALRKSVEINRKQSRVTVNGCVDPNKVLNRVKRTGKKRAEFWPYVPQHVVTYRHASGVYDKRAPSGYVRNMQSFTPSAETEEKFMSLFSEDNGSCYRRYLAAFSLHLVHGSVMEKGQ